MAKILYTNGEIKNVENNELTIEFMQKVVGGYIEIVPVSNGEYIICNEDGKLTGLPINQKASNIYQIGIIAGDVIFAKKNEIR